MIEYKVICDETNNPPETVARNELHVTLVQTPAPASVRSLMTPIDDAIRAATEKKRAELGFDPPEFIVNKTAKPVQ